MNNKTLIATNPDTQTVVIIFPEPMTHLVLSVDQTEALANDLLAKAKLLRLQQNN